MGSRGVWRRLTRVLFGAWALCASAAFAADLQVSQYSFTPNPAAHGGTADFQVRVTNNGPQTINDATLHIAVSSNFRVDAGNFPAYCTLGGAVGAQTLDCALPSMGIGSVTLDYTATAISNGSTNTTATISSPTAADPNHANDSLTITPAVVTGADLSTVKDDNLPGHTIAAGGTIAYTVAVSNGGPDATSAVTLTDNLPSAMDFLFASATGTNWSCSQSNQVVTCTYNGAAQMGAYPTITITGTVVRTTSGTITNNAFASLNSPLVADPNGNNNAAPPVVTTITPGTDLKATKSMPATIILGASATVTIGVTNVGPQAVTGATVTDAVPSNLTVGAVPAGCALAGATVTCTTGALPAGAAQTFAIPVTGTTGGTGITNTATVAPPAGITDPNAGNDSASVTFQVQSPGANLSLTKAKTDANDVAQPVGPNQDLHSRITVRNNGPSARTYDAAHPIKITDTLGPNESYVTVTNAAGGGAVVTCGYAAPVVTCTRNGTGTLASGATFTFVIVTHSGNAANGSLANTACTGGTGGSIANAGEGDGTTSDDCASATINASNSAADLAIDKSVSLSPGAGYTAAGLDIPGGSNAFFIRLVATNNGPSTSTSVTAIDKIAGNYRVGPSATSYAVVDATGAVLAPGNVSFAGNGTVTWTIGTLASGATQTLIIRATRPFDAGTTIAAQTNTATISSADIYDPVAGNNSSSATYTIRPVADVQVTSKVASPNPVQAGVTTTYTIDTKNNGPNFAENVTLTDTIDTTRFDLVGQPTTTKGDGTCSVTTGAGTATITCALGMYGATSNNTFQVFQSVRPRYPFGGSTAFPQTYTNTATIATTSTETNSGNNSNFVNQTITAPSLDLSVTKQEPGPEFDPIAYGLDLTYDIRASNFGPSRADNVVVTDIPQPPAGYTMTFNGFTVNDVGATSGLTLYTPPHPNCAVVGATVECRLDSTDPNNNYLDALRQTIFRVRFTPGGTAPSSPLTFTDTANIVATEQPTTTSSVADSQLANNSATQTTTVLPSSDLEVVSKTRVTPSPVAANTPIQYNIVIANNGVSPTTQVRLTDQLPAGFVLTTPAPTFVASGGTTVSGMTCTGSNTVLCVLNGNFPPDAGHASTVTVTLYVLASNPYAGPTNTDLTNTATIAPGQDAGGNPLTADPIASNNSKTATVQISPTAASASIAGTVFADANGDNVVQAGEGLANVTVALQKSDGTAVASTVTAADGSYSFTGLAADTYQLIETQPPAYNDGSETAGTSGGTVNNAAFGATAATNTISAITLASGVAATGYLFQELPPPGSIAGIVFADANADNAVQAGEGLANVTVALQKSDGTAVASTVTGADGSYSFTGLPAGTYQLIETQPAAYTDGRETAGTSGGTVNNAAFGATPTTNTISAITLASGAAATGYLFQELPPPGSIAGIVFADANADNAVQAGEGLANVTVALQKSDGTAVASTVTAADGSYSFTGLPAGTYQLIETQPAAYTDGRETAGTSGGTANNAAFGTTPTTNTISGITLASGAAATGYLFQELAPASIAGTVFADANADNAVQPGEGLAGATVTLSGTDGAGGAVGPQSAVTDASGAFSFTGLPPGSYSLVETQPAAYFDGRETAGTSGGTVNNASFGASASTNTVSAIALAPAAAATGYLFQELSGASISGNIYRDLNNNGAQDAGEMGFGPGSFAATPQLHLTGTDYSGQAVDLTTAVDANGAYSFAGLSPSDATGYTVTELVQPTSTADGLDRNGVGAVIAGSAGRTAPESIVVGQVTAGAALANRDFGEIAGASLSGSIYLDTNTNSTRDAGESTGLAGGVVRLTGANDLGNPVDCSITTDASGAYSFPYAGDSNVACQFLRPGAYTLTETPPAGFTHVGVFIGTAGGSAGGTSGANTPAPGAGNTTVSNIAIAAGAGANRYDFAEKGQGLSGYVYVDRNNNGTRDQDETGIAGVTVTLSGTTAGGQDVCALTSCTTVSDATGTFAFGNVPGSNGAGYTLTEQSQSTAPLAAYGDGLDGAGMVGGATRGTAGNDVISGIVLNAGELGVNYRFGERGSALAGHVFVDANDDGAFQAGETPLPTIAVTLSGTTSSGQDICAQRAALTPALSCSVASGADGSYLFTDLPSGSYSLVEAQPGAYGDGKEGAGTPAGTVNNAAFGATGATNGITAIPLGAGVAGAGYDFGERAFAVSGRVFKDPQRDGVDSGGEPGIGGVTIRLVQNGTVVASKDTAADGSYSFTGLTAGSYTVTEEQPLGYGSSSPNSVVVSVTGAGTPTVNFAETVSTLAGSVFSDTSNDGVRQTGEAGIAGVTVTLAGSDAAGASVSRTAITDASGNFLFGDLLSGSYTLTETQPAGYADGLDGAGTAGGSVGNDVISAILLPVGVDATGYGFGERGQAITGAVYVDANLNGTRDAGEAGIGGVTITLQKPDGSTVATTTTSADGSYGFANVGLGQYLIVETQPAGYAEAAENSSDRVAVTVGATVPPPVNFGERTQAITGAVYVDANLNGTRDASEPGIGGVTITLQRPDGSVVATTTTAGDGGYGFANIPLGPYVIVETQPAGYAEAAENPSDRVALTVGATAPAPVNFGERSQALGGVVYVDANLNGTRDGNETGIGGVTITLQRPDGSVVATTTTAADGSYSFANVALGQYVVVEAQPAGYAEAPENPSDRVAVTVGAAAPPPVNFGERRQSIGGTVYVDTNLNGKQDSGEPGLGAVTITLQDPAGTTVATTTTAPTGSYTFANVGTGGYIVVETQPTGYIDAAENPTNRAPVTVAAADTAPINFGERGQSLGGIVYLDGNLNGTRDTAEPGIAGVTVTLQRPDGSIVATTVTAADGSYSFTGLATGDYVVIETQPAGYGDAAENQTNRAPVTIGTGATPAINFGERAGSIAGSVYNDSNFNGRRDGTEPPIAGVTLTLSGTDARGNAVTQTAVTGADGTYRFTSVPGGTYRIVETQPANYQDANELAGTAGGNVLPPPGDTISNIVLGPAQDATSYLFGERGPGAQLSGSVWLDVNHNDIREPGEPGKVGWTVQLIQGGMVIATTLTDANGEYKFTDVPPGSGYSLRFRDPSSAAAFGDARPNETGAFAQDGVMSAGNPAGAQFSNGDLSGLTLLPGANIVQQSLPLDPQGVLYDPVRRVPITGATITITGPAGFDPATQLLGGAGNASQTVGPDGMYQFLLLAGAPNGVYTLTVTPPPGGVYSSTFPSTLFPPCPGPLVVGAKPAPLLISTYDGAPPANATASCVVGTASTGYYLSFVLTAGISADVINNNIPLDPILQGSIVVTKTTPMRDVTRGGLVPYTISAHNVLGGAVPNIVVTDRVPAGFRYRSGSARLNGVPITPVENGRLLLFPAQNFAANETKRIDLILTVGAGVGFGEHVNQAYAVNGIVNSVVSNVAEATVRLQPDADFDCSDVLGKVFDDRNGNGYEDEGEPGLPGVRVVTVAGDLVTTDAEGRYHITCPMIPNEDRGSNFILKLDPRTLPTGFRLTSENPQTIRLTPGKFVKLNFGASLLRVVRLDVRDSVFSGEQLAPDYAAKIDPLIVTLEGQPSVLRISYAAHGEDAGLIRKRVAALKALIEHKWGEKARRCRLIVEVEEGK